MSARNVIAIAREMMGRYGNNAASMVDRRVRENAAAGDSEAAIFWGQVAQAIRGLDSKPDFHKITPAGVAKRFAP